MGRRLFLAGRWAMGVAATCAAAAVAWSEPAPVAAPPAGAMLELCHDGRLGCEASAAAKQAWLAGVDPGVWRPGADRAQNITATDLLHNDLDIEIFPATEEIAGSNLMTVRARVQNVVHFDVRISSSFTITDVRVNGAPAAWAWQIPDTTIRVTLDGVYNIGDEFDVLVAYNGPTNRLGVGSVTWTSAGGEPWVYTLCQPWFSYTWWPCKDDNTDKSTADLRFTIPDHLQIVSNGVLQSDTQLAGDRRTLHYRTMYPTATYLYQFSLGDYNLFSGSHPHAGGAMPMEFAILKVSDSGNARNAWLRTEDMMPVFESLFGPYPFLEEKYGIYQFAFGGGMEHQTMTGQGTTAEWITAHELAHSWWGNMITCAKWEDIWLNEGFATYSEVLWLEFEFGSSDPAARITALSQRVPLTVDGTVFVYTPNDFVRIFNYDLSYLKGGWVLHMLRGVVGDQAFFDTLAAYRAAFEYGAATTPEFQAVAESVSGMDLSTFFQQWIYEPGAPAYESSFATVTAGGQTFAEVLIEQNQSVTYPVFEMPVGLRFATPSGDVDAVAQSSAQSQHFLVPLPDVASSMQLDPDLWILKTADTTGTFSPGPPRVIASSPAPGEYLDQAPSAITVGFHRDVQIGAGDVSLVGDVVGAVGFSFTYDAPTMTATLTPDAPLAADCYTVTIADSVAWSSLALDGEIAGALLPSGDGVAGGAAEIVFELVPAPCEGDVDGDGDTDVFDFAEMSVHFGAGPGATRSMGDLTGDGHVDVFDFGVLSGDFGCDVAAK